ncbi:Las1 protein [Dioscorea alata]|uniref:Las1 protein n=2 Tax=Dioscorea alata TaxID=55571 RepID=A0ACB7VE53_DIOAL|nr:Las1 protein [Dioscorea alata]KAH7672041.1 Las1 protein [Dioscorea alata]
MMEDMVMIGLRNEFMAGYKLVPWSTWGQWNFVRESIFSSNPESVAAALRKVAAWRSRGCLPVAIDVTAVILEIQCQDPFFREGLLDSALSSEELLAMLYCMAIVRLVNVFVEPLHKKTRRSISELAEAIGLPRALIDIRHESSHRDLPSLQLVRLASVKALDWLKSNYWEPQRKAIPDVRKEIRCRLREMIHYLKAKYTQRMKAKRAKRSHQLRACGKLSSQVTGKILSSKAIDFNKRISKISISVCRVYSAYPLDVVSVLMEFFQLHVSDFSDITDKEITEETDVCHEPLINSMSLLKTIITKLSHNRPRLLLSMLKIVLEMIKDIHEKGQDHFLSPLSEAKVCQIKHLCSFVPWLLMNLKTLKDSGRIGLTEELKPSAGRDAVQKVSLKKLLRLCLSLSAVGDKHLSESVLLLSDLSGNTNLTERLKKLPLPCLQDQDAAEYSCSNIESVILQEELAIKKATEKLQYLKLQSRISNVKSMGTEDQDNDVAKNSWILAKSWIPCPIADDDCQGTIIPENNHDKFGKDHTPRENHKINIQSPDTENAIKKLRLTTEERLYSIDVINPMEGRLLIDGVWKKVDEAEFFAIQSNIRTFVQ